MADTATPTGQELVTLSDAQVEQALLGQLDENFTLAIEDPAQVQRQIIERILGAKDADEVLGGNRAVGGKEVLGRPFTLKGVRWLKSRFEASIPVFAVLDVSMLDSGEDLAVTTSSGNVMAQAYQLHRLGSLPCDVKIAESDTDTAAGYRPQWLENAKAAA